MEEYTKKRDGTKGFRQTIELCDDVERCTRATVFLNEDGVLGLERGSILAIRSARVSVWQGVVGISVAASGVVADPDVPQVALLRRVAAAVVEGGSGEGDPPMPGGQRPAVEVSCDGAHLEGGEGGAEGVSTGLAPSAVNGDVSEWQLLELPGGQQVLLNRRTMETAPVPERAATRPAEACSSGVMGSSAPPLLRGAGAVPFASLGEGSGCVGLVHPPTPLLRGAGTGERSRGVGCPHFPDLDDFVGSCSTYALLCLHLAAPPSLWLCASFIIGVACGAQVR